MDQLKVYFDPRCPWCYQTSRWAWQLEELGLVELDWGVYSLEIANLPEGKDPNELATTGHSALALRTAVVLRERKDSQTMGRFYHALGRRAWETEPPATDMMAVVKESVAEIGFDPSVVDEAIADLATWTTVMESHEEFVTRHRAIGVPSLQIDGGDGPVIFGPVISVPPSDEEAVELWSHVSWLLRYRNFAELKRSRQLRIDLPGWRYPVGERTFGNKIWLAPDSPANS